MNLKIDSKIALELSAIIGLSFFAGAAFHKSHKEFRENFDNKIYPKFKLVVKEYGPTMLRIVLVKALENKPQARKAFLDLIDSIENGRTKLSKDLLNELYKIRDEFPEIQKKLEKLPTENK